MDPNPQILTAEEDLVVPNDYDNIDELVAPSPIEWHHELQRQGYLEDRKSIPGRSGTISKQ